MKTVQEKKINYTVHHKHTQHVHGAQFSTVTIVPPPNCVNKLNATWNAGSYRQQNYLAQCNFDYKQLIIIKYMGKI
jgi:hypothetical protein